MDDVNLANYEKIVCLIGDEMHVREDLVYNKFSGELTGFINLGDMNTSLQKLEEEILTCAGEKATPTLATTVFVLMVRGLIRPFKFPYATFPAKADQLLPIYMEALFHLERCGFQVVALTLDGYSANRRLMALLSDSNNLSSSIIKHKSMNPFSQEGDRYVFFFSDPPHLLKTIRNSFASPTRNLMV